MLPILIAAAAAGSILLVVFGIAMSGSTDVSARLERYASPGIGGGGLVDGDVRRSVLLQGVTRAIERRNMGGKLANDLAHADLNLKPAEWVLFWIFTPFLLAGGGYLLGTILPSLRNPIVLAILFFVGIFAPSFYLRRRQAKRLAAFDRQLPDTITLLANSLRSGSSFLQGIELVTRESGPPLADEFDRVIREMNLGQTQEQALANLVGRLASEDLELMVTAISIQSAVGGNLATVLDAIAFTIRERMRIKGEINTLTAMQKYSGYVLMLLPVGLGGILFLIAPHYMTLLLAKPPEFLGLPLGVLFLTVGALSMAGGYFFIRRIVDIKV